MWWIKLGKNDRLTKSVKGKSFRRRILCGLWKSLPCFWELRKPQIQVALCTFPELCARLRKTWKALNSGWSRGSVQIGREGWGRTCLIKGWICAPKHTESTSAKTGRCFGSRHVRKSLSNQQTAKIIKWKLSRNTKKNTGFMGLVQKSH